MKKQYRKKSTVIEAVQLLKEKERIAGVIEWVDEIDMSTSIIGRNACIQDVIDRGFYICTPEGKIKVDFGDFIIKGINGEFLPCKPDVFKKIYEEI